MFMAGIRPADAWLTAMASQIAASNLASAASYLARSTPGISSTITNLVRLVEPVSQPPDEQSADQQTLHARLTVDHRHRRERIHGGCCDLVSTRLGPNQTGLHEWRERFQDCHGREFPPRGQPFGD